MKSLLTKAGQVFSAAELNYLRWLAAADRVYGQVPDDGRPMGVHFGTQRALVKAGLLAFGFTADEPPKVRLELTDAGRAAVARHIPAAPSEAANACG